MDIVGTMATGAPEAIADEDQLIGEARLVQELKARSTDAWGKVYDEFYNKLYRYAFARVRDGDVAEDLAATVFLRALTSIDSYSYKGRPLLAWLYRIARNVVSDHQRSLFRGRTGGQLKEVPFRALRRFFGSRRPEATSIDEMRFQSNTASDSDPASMVERLDLRNALDRLTGDQREVIVLRYFVGLSASEVAAALGKHERAVYSLQTRAIGALRRHLT